LSGFAKVSVVKNVTPHGIAAITKRKIFTTDILKDADSIARKAQTSARNTSNGAAHEREEIFE